MYQFKYCVNVRTAESSHPDQYIIWATKCEARKERTVKYYFQDEHNKNTIYEVDVTVGCEDIERKVTKVSVKSLFQLIGEPRANPKQPFNYLRFFYKLKRYNSMITLFIVENTKLSCMS